MHTHKTASRPTDKFSKAMGHNINIKISIVFVYTSNKTPKTKLRKQFDSQQPLKQNKTLRDKSDKICTKPAY